MDNVEYRLYRHKTLHNKWKVVRDYSLTIPDCWLPVYTVVHKKDNGKDKVIYSELK